MTKPDVARYNKSKLIIKDQWASHPGIEERVEALERLNIHKTENITTPAMDLFANKENIQERITENLFSMINYTQKPVVSALEAFKNDYTQSVMDNSFPEAYNGYYDSKNPVYVDLETIDLTADIEPVEQLFSKEKIDLVYNFVALENDKAILTSIIESGYAIDSFDYDGQKYPIDEAKNLISQIEKEIAVSEELIEKNDYKITRFFYRKAVHGGHSATYKEKYLRFFEVDTAYSKKFELYQTIMNAISFVSNKTPNEQIESNFKSVLTLEVELKREIKQLLEYPDPIHDIPEDVRRNFEKYLSREWIYFSDETYYHDPFEIFITAVNNYNNMLLRRYFLLKKDLLNYQIQLLNP